MIYPANRFYEFPISAIVWHELAPKLDTNLIDGLICENLKIKDYSEIVKQYFFIFILFQKKRKELHFLQKKTSFLISSLPLDFKNFEQASQKEALQMQAELYLEGIKLIPKCRGMKKVFFDWQKFYADVRNLFEKQGWILKTKKDTND